MHYRSASPNPPPEMKMTPTNLDGAAHRACARRDAARIAYTEALAIAADRATRATLRAAYRNAATAARVAVACANAYSAARRTH